MILNIFFILISLNLYSLKSFDQLFFTSFFSIKLNLLNCNLNIKSSFSCVNELMCSICSGFK
ncbi:hypothetical protein A0H76_3043 [Hepatospora eriocheir]|uniref:Uncharacterized protein n=1 Tax=Hepatospora eriocheir TaxID=1081669 RepID=A0A1X0QGF0_9MICR|nr:hypothetical protein A0H76_3043 [Hepatospora eriocheir]